VGIFMQLKGGRGYNAQVYRARGCDDAGACASDKGGVEEVIHPMSYLVLRPLLATHLEHCPA